MDSPGARLTHLEGGRIRRRAESEEGMGLNSLELAGTKGTREVRKGDIMIYPGGGEEVNKEKMVTREDGGSTEEVTIDGEEGRE